MPTSIDQMTDDLYVYEFIRSRVAETGVFPSRLEISRFSGLRTHEGVQCCLLRLCHKNLLRKMTVRGRAMFGVVDPRKIVAPERNRGNKGTPETSGG